MLARGDGRMQLASAEDSLVQDEGGEPAEGALRFQGAHATLPLGRPPDRPLAREALALATALLMTVEPS